MKKLLFAMLSFFWLGTVAVAQSTNTQAPAAKAANVAVFEWNQTTNDFGNIPQGTPATATFKFKNTGKVPLVISNVQGSCGCTVPTWPREPIAPGETSEIKATYNAAAAGPFNKTVTITANVEGGMVVLTVKGNVEPVNN